MTSDFERLFPEAPSATRELVGQRVRLRDVPSARGVVQGVVSPTNVWVRWEGQRFRVLEAVSRLERLS